MSGNCLLRPVSQACSYRSYRRILLEACLTFGLESHPSSGVRQGTMINLKGVGSLSFFVSCFAFVMRQLIRIQKVSSSAGKLGAVWIARVRVCVSCMRVANLHCG